MNNYLKISFGWEKTQTVKFMRGLIMSALSAAVVYLSVYVVPPDPSKPFSFEMFFRYVAISSAVNALKLWSTEEVQVPPVQP